MRAMGQNDAGPIISIHTGKKAEEQASKKVKGGTAVQLSTHRVWAKSDHVNRLADVDHRDTHWREH
jgi:hypothetical protein